MIASVFETKGSLSLYQSDHSNLVGVGILSLNTHYNPTDLIYYPRRTWKFVQDNK